MYLAYTSFAVRMLQGRDILKSTAAALDAHAFLQLCRRFHVGGAQVDLSQLPVDNPEALAAVRSAFEQQRIAIELSVPFRYLESPEAYAQAVAVALSLGATRARVALLYGRRYESFETRGGVGFVRREVARHAHAHAAGVRSTSSPGRDREPQGLARDGAGRAAAGRRQPERRRVRRFRQQPRSARGSRRDDRRCSRPTP